MTSGSAVRVSLGSGRDDGSGIGGRGRARDEGRGERRRSGPVYGARGGISSTSDGRGGGEDTGSTRGSFATRRRRRGGRLGSSAWASPTKSKMPAAAARRATRPSSR